MADDDALETVRAAAEAVVEAQVAEGDEEAARQRALAAARVALDAGHAISAIARAESAGEKAARERLGGQVLRSVERAARKLADATAEYERTIVQAVRVGLAARDIAARANVSHGTVAAVARRHEQASATSAPQAAADEASGSDAHTQEQARPRAA